MKNRQPHAVKAHYGRGRLSRFFVSMLTMSGIIAGSLALSVQSANAFTTINSVKVGAQTGNVTYAGGPISYTVTVAASHSGFSTHDMNLTAVTDGSASVSFGTPPACQTESGSKNYTFTLNVNVPGGDTPGSYPNSLVVTASVLSLIHI